MGIIIAIIAALLLFIRWDKKRHQIIELNEETKKENARIQEENLDFQRTNLRLRDEWRGLEGLKKQAEQDLETLTKLIEQSQDYVNRTQANTEQNLQKHLTMYTETLEQAYQEAEDRHDKAVAKLALEMHNVNAELDKLKATRKATMEANLREEEIKNKLDFYCLKPKTTDINDIRTLEGIKYQLNNPRILSMLIWSTYFQKDMTTLCNKILGLNTITGIYKITNQINNKCYIGQSVDISKRWKDHAKCGLGIDAPQGNKLYKDMQEVGIWNFSWELLEACPREQLNEKEKYYINLYQSQDFGYNSTKGNK